MDDKENVAEAIDSDALCGDWPAPCNCDNPETHDGSVPRAIVESERRTVQSEPSLIECPHWSPGRITMRRGCTACEAEPQGEPTDAYVRAVWDALGPSVTVAFEYDELRAALRAAAEQGGENRD